MKKEKFDIDGVISNILHYFIDIDFQSENLDSVMKQVHIIYSSFLDKYPTMVEGSTLLKSLGSEARKRIVLEGVVQEYIKKRDFNTNLENVEIEKGKILELTKNSPLSKRQIIDLILNQMED